MDKPFQRINRGDATNLAGRFGVYRVLDVFHDADGRPVNVLVESDDWTEWFPASACENVRTVEGWAEWMGPPHRSDTA